jgi:hypothetical protein
MTTPEKPLGRKSYGHVPHLPGSRVGPGDHVCEPGQARIATARPRDAFDRVIVLEKLDGSNVGVARIDDQIVALIRAGYRAAGSKYEQHHHFDRWVRANAARFSAVLANGERLCGEWLAQAHGTRYALAHEPFVAFDLMRGDDRLPYDTFLERLKSGFFTSPALLHWGPPIDVAAVLRMLGPFGRHGALDPVEGADWRVERQKRLKGTVRWEVDFLAKHVRNDKSDGCYLPEISGKPAMWNATVGWDGLVSLIEPQRDSVSSDPSS